MITNERQYKITRARLREFGQALVLLGKLPAAPRNQPWLRLAQKESIEEQIDQLQQQIDEYEKLKEGEIEISDPVNAVSRMPLILIQSRIARGWDQEELASRLGMKKQQIQRYEQNNYAQATMSVLSRVASVLAGQSDPASPGSKQEKSRSPNAFAKGAKSQAARKQSSGKKNVSAKQRTVKGKKAVR